MFTIEALGGRLGLLRCIRIRQRTWYEKIGGFLVRENIPVVGAQEGRRSTFLVCDVVES